MNVEAGIINDIRMDTSVLDVNTLHVDGQGFYSHTFDSIVREKQRVDFQIYTGKINQYALPSNDEILPFEFTILAQVITITIPLLNGSYIRKTFNVSSKDEYYEARHDIVVIIMMQEAVEDQSMSVITGQASNHKPDSIFIDSGTNIHFLEVKVYGSSSSNATSKVRMQTMKRMGDLMGMPVGRAGHQRAFIFETLVLNSKTGTFNSSHKTSDDKHRYIILMMARLWKTLLQIQNLTNFNPRQRGNRIPRSARLGHEILKRVPDVTLPKRINPDNLSVVSDEHIQLWDQIRVNHEIFDLKMEHETINAIDVLKENRGSDSIVRDRTKMIDKYLNPFILNGKTYSLRTEIDNLREYPLSQKPALSGKPGTMFFPNDYSDLKPGGSPTHELFYLLIKYARKNSENFIPMKDDEIYHKAIHEVHTYNETLQEYMASIFASSDDEKTRRIIAHKMSDLNKNINTVDPTKLRERNLCKIKLPDGLNIYLTLHGRGSEEMRKQYKDLIKNTKDFSHTPYSLNAKTSDLEAFMSDFSIFDKYEGPINPVQDKVNEIIIKSMEDAGFDNTKMLTKEFFLKIRTSRIYNIFFEWQTIMYAVAAHLGKINSSGEFTLIRQPFSDNLIAIGSSGPSKNVFLAHLVKKEADGEARSQKFFSFSSKSPLESSKIKFWGVPNKEDYNTSMYHVTDCYTMNTNQIVNTMILADVFPALFAVSLTSAGATNQDMIDILDGKMSLRRKFSFVLRRVLTLMLTAWESSDNTGKVLANFRYGLHESLVKSIYAPNPFKVVSKFPNFSRSRLCSYIIRRYIESCTLMTGTPPKRVDNKGDDMIYADSRYENFVCPLSGEIKVPIDFSYIIDSFYGNTLSMKTAGSNTTLARILVARKYIEYAYKHLDKIDDIKEEVIKRTGMSYEEAVRENPAENTGFMGIKDDPTHDHKIFEFCPSFVKSAIDHDKKNMDGLHKDTYWDKTEKQIAVELGKLDYTEIQKLKASTVMVSPDQWNEKKPGEGVKYKARTKLVHSTMDMMLKLPSSEHPLLLIPEIIVMVDELQDGRTYFSTFPKDQHGGVREILVATALTYFVVKFIEAVSRAMCMFRPNEMLTHISTRSHQISSHSARRNDFASEKIKKYGSENVAVFHSSTSGDCTKWAPGANLSEFSFFIYHMIKDYDEKLARCMVRLINMHARKVVEMDAVMLNEIYKNHDAYKDSDPILGRLSTDLLKGEKKGMYKAGNKVLEIESSFLQGILHYLSSLRHVVYKNYVNHILVKYLTGVIRSLGFECNVIVDTPLNSDDFTDMISVIIWSKKGRIPEDIYSYIPIEITTGMIGALKMMSLCGIQISYPKTVLSDFSGLKEFVSIWEHSNCSNLSVLRQISPAVRPSPNADYLDVMYEQTNSLQAMMRTGTSTSVCSKIEVFQAIVILSIIGMHTNSIFYTMLSIMEQVPHYIIGCKPLQPESLCGTMSHAYSSWLRAKKNVRTRKVDYLLHREASAGFDQETGMKTLRIHFRAGSSNKRQIFLSKIKSVYEKITGVAITKWELVEDYSYLLYLPSGTDIERVVFALLKYMSIKPKSFNYGNFLQSSMNQYILTEPVVQISENNTSRGRVQTKRSLMGLANGIYSNIIGMEIPPEGAIDGPYVFSKQYQEIQNIVETTSYAFKVRWENSKPRREITWRQAPTDGATIDLKSCIAWLWYGYKEDDISLTDIHESFGVHMVNYPGLTDTIKETMKNMNFNTEGECALYYSGLNVKYFGIQYTGYGNHSSFQELVQNIVRLNSSPHYSYDKKYISKRKYMETDQEGRMRIQQIQRSWLSHEDKKKRIFEEIKKYAKDKLPKDYLPKFEEMKSSDKQLYLMSTFLNYPSALNSIINSHTSMTSQYFIQSAKAHRHRGRTIYKGESILLIKFGVHVAKLRIFDSTVKLIEFTGSSQVFRGLWSSFVKIFKNGGYYGLHQILIDDNMKFDFIVRARDFLPVAKTDEECIPVLVDVKRMQNFVPKNSEFELNYNDDLGLVTLDVSIPVGNKTIKRTLSKLYIQRLYGQTDEIGEPDAEEWKAIDYWINGRNCPSDKIMDLIISANRLGKSNASYKKRIKEWMTNQMLTSLSDEITVVNRIKETREMITWESMDAYSKETKVKELTSVKLEDFNEDDPWDDDDLWGDANDDFEEIDFKQLMSEGKIPAIPNQESTIRLDAARYLGGHGPLKEYGEKIRDDYFAWLVEMKYNLWEYTEMRDFEELIMTDNLKQSNEAIKKIIGDSIRNESLIYDSKYPMRTNVLRLESENIIPSDYVKTAMSKEAQFAGFTRIDEKLTMSVKDLVLTTISPVLLSGRAKISMKILTEMSNPTFLHDFMQIYQKNWELFVKIKDMSGTKVVTDDELGLFILE
jgi:hypothetical protein